MSNSTHKVNVVRIKEILPHPNADRLGIVYIGGYQCVVQKDSYKVGDLAIYIQPDTIVPEIKQFDFLWTGHKEFMATGIVPARTRRITVRKFRGQWSEGLLMPISEFIFDRLHSVLYNGREATVIVEDTDVAELLGFTHYEEPEEKQDTRQQSKQHKGKPKSIRGWFWYLVSFFYKRPTYGEDQTKPPKIMAPIYDVESFKNYGYIFDSPEEDVIVTEKLHGFNARYLFDGEKMHVGSHNYWKSEKSTCVWRRTLRGNPWIEEFCKMFPQHTLYGEIVPVFKGFNYGIGDDKPRLFAFDVLKPNGAYVDKRDLFGLDPLTLGQHLVPLFNGHCHKFDRDTILSLVEGPSMVPGAKHIREGIVVSSAVERRVRGIGRAQLKLKSMAFLEKAGKV